MSSQRPERVVHQDYIAKIRYSNQLPPPPNPPKLLDIPGTGLAGGQYTSAGYASRLAREQPLNIEADAELGMPIDLVGIPGVFDGNEKAITAQPGLRTLHARDKALLKPLNALGKPASANEQVSFLRRTEYAASSSPQMFASGSSKDLLRLRNDPRRKTETRKKDDPINIARNIVKGFDVAYPQDAHKGEDSTENLRGAEITTDEIKAWQNPRHPTNPSLQLLDEYPVLPDLEAIPPGGFYMVMKLITNPLPVTDKYDDRLDAAIFRPTADDDRRALFQQETDEWKAEEAKNVEAGKPKPLMNFDYEYYLPDDPDAVRGLKRKVDVLDPEKDDDELYTDTTRDGARVFKYSRLRTYETYNQSGDPDEFYNDTVALVLHDPETDVGRVPGAESRLAKGAYIYPVAQRTAIRPKRRVGGPSQMPDDEEKVEMLNVTVREMQGEVEEVREARAKIDPDGIEAGE